jgi:hypothetical protein
VKTADYHAGGASTSGTRHGAYNTIGARISVALFAEVVVLQEKRAKHLGHGEALLHCLSLDRSVERFGQIEGKTFESDRSLCSSPRGPSLGVCVSTAFPAAVNGGQNEPPWSFRYRLAMLRGRRGSKSRTAFT